MAVRMHLPDDLGVVEGDDFHAFMHALYERLASLPDDFPDGMVQAMFCALGSIMTRITEQAGIESDIVLGLVSRADEDDEVMPPALAADLESVRGQADDDGATVH